MINDHVLQQNYLPVNSGAAETRGICATEPEALRAMTLFDNTTSREPASAGIVWLTGLSGAGKTTIANALRQALSDRQIRACIIDGDELRATLNRDLGFSPEDRAESVRRAADVAHLMRRTETIVIVALISPYAAGRNYARSVAPTAFCEVHVDAPLAVVESRDPKGLYAKARRGEMKQFTGIDAPYEAPEAPDVRLDTSKLTVDQCVLAIVNRLADAGWIQHT